MITPFTADDLRVIAKSLDEWNRLLTGNRNGGDYKERAALIHSITVTRPDDAEIIGKFILEDGWVGFMPKQKGDE